VIILGLIAAISLLAPLIAPYDPLDEAGQTLEVPSTAHPFGTDLIGRDVFSRVLYGGGRTLLIAALALLLSVLPGLIIGLVAGYNGGWPDALIGALVDGLLAIPSLLIALSVVAITGNGPAQVALAVGISGWPTYTRVTRAATRAVRGLPFVEAARSIGAPPGHILRWHVLPNIAQPLIGFATVTLGWAIMSAATLNFLGFGGDPASPEWGAMLADGRQVYRIAPWVALAPGLAIVLTLFVVNRLADTIGESGRS
jgi:ABC-type dipeptide/oligopeptide/nickel transport system permease subunit